MTKTSYSLMARCVSRGGTVRATVSSCRSVEVKIWARGFVNAGNPTSGTAATWTRPRELGQRANCGLMKKTASFPAAAVDSLSPDVLPLLKPRECPDAWPPDVPEVETPPTQPSCPYGASDRSKEKNGFAGICRDAESPSLFSVCNSPIPSRWIAHLRGIHHLVCILEDQHCSKWSSRL